jgi:4-hydroxy-2-oxoheptanedioate aldolase
MSTTPVNTFKARLREPGCQIGLFCGLADPIAAELVAGAGFDWMLLDAEHGPNDLRTLLAQLQAVAAYPTHPIVRPPSDDRIFIKKLLDIGVQTLLVPMVETASQAAATVAAVRYPPAGVRGVGTGLARAAQWNRHSDYFARADSEMCVIVQIESREGLANLASIAAIEGVDAVFIGPSDLAAGLGYLGEPGHPEVVAAVNDALAAVRASGKASGVLGVTPELAEGYVAGGASFVGIGSDTTLLAKATDSLVARFKEG